LIGWLGIAVAACVVGLVLLSAGEARGEDRAAAAPAPRVLVLEDCDTNPRLPAFGDGILILDSRGQRVDRIGGLDVCESLFDHAVSPSADGQFCLVCEQTPNRLAAYDTASGRLLWSLPGNFTSAVVAGDAIYGLTSDARIYGKEMLAIGLDGKVINQAPVKGGCIVADPNGQFLWLVGADIKKCDTTLKVLLTVYPPIAWCAVSADIGPDGSLWALERSHPDVKGSLSRLLCVSPAGVVTKTIPVNDFWPFRVRVDRSDGSIWVTGKVIHQTTRLPARWSWPIVWGRDFVDRGPRTCKYSPEGKILVGMKEGGTSLDLDRSDGSVWIAGESTLMHCSADGKKQVQCKAAPTHWRQVAVVQLAGQAKPSSNSTASSPK
jgi:hypothetical protein